MPQEFSILSVDPDLESQTTLATLIASEGCVLEKASDGSDGLRKAEARLPALILLDLMSPAMTGLHLTQQFRGHPCFEEIPIWIMLGAEDRSQILPALEAGADDWIAKPFARAELRLRLRNLARRERSRRSRGQRHHQPLQHKQRFLEQTPNPSVTLHQQSAGQLGQQAAFLDLIPDAVLLADATGILRFWNQGAERMYGWTAEEALGQTLEGLLGPRPVPTRQAVEGSAAIGSKPVEMFHQHKDGKSLRVLVRRQRFDEEGGAIIYVCTNVTDQRKLETQMLQSQRLESLGALSGGIAHDLNNILTPIAMGAEILHQSVSDDAQAGILETIRSCCERGAELIRQILTFARGKRQTEPVFDLGKLLRDLHTTLEHLFPRVIKIEFDVPDDLHDARGHYTQIYQVVMNLAVNARDAMPRGGRLRMQASNLHDPPRVEVRVSDTGIGIPEEHQERIFEPFFTTKGSLHGTGLGLATVARILEEHHGTIQVESQVQGGTCFIFTLPAEPSTPQSVSSSSQLPLFSGQGETILVVDDEDSIRSVMAAVLSSSGYSVQVAGNGPDALRQLAAYPGPLDLVLSDLNMPETNILSMLQAIRQSYPAIKVVLCSGVPPEADLLNELQVPFSAVLDKPFTIPRLLEVVHQSLRVG